MSSDGRRFPGYFVGSGTALQHRSCVSAVPLCTSLARGVPLSRLYRGEGMGNAERALAVRRLSVSGVGYRRHDFPRQPLAADHVVSSDVVHDESEKWCQCLGPATGVGFWELQDRLGSAPQAAASNGTARPGSAAGCEGDRRFYPRLNPGVQYDVHYLAHREENADTQAMWWLGVFGSPLSAALDTALLPWDVPYWVFRPKSSTNSVPE